MQAPDYVRQNRSFAAVQCGPVVYCAEGIDNIGKVDFEIAENPEFDENYEKDLLGGILFYYVYLQVRLNMANPNAQICIIKIILIP